MNKEEIVKFAKYEVYDFDTNQTACVCGEWEMAEMLAYLLAQLHKKEDGKVGYRGIEERKPGFDFCPGGGQVTYFYKDKDGKVRRGGWE